MPITIRDLLRDAAIENGALSQSENLSSGDAQFLLGRLNRMLDGWNAQREALYAEQGVTYPLTPGLAVHTIGTPGATWDLPSGRPVSIESAMLILPSSTPQSYTPIRLGSAQAWYQAQTVPALATQYPTDLYYEPAWPLGRLYFWPVPTAAFSVQLQIRRELTAVDYDDTLTLPPGYQDAITLTLAEMTCRALGRELSPVLVQQAGMARHRIFVNNVTVPRIATQDSGMPSGNSAAQLPSWDYLIGS